MPDKVAITWTCAPSPHKVHGPVREIGSGTSSPVITHERVMGSLRNSMSKENKTRQTSQMGFGIWKFVIGNFAR
jgi:hypothetical protein